MATKKLIFNPVTKVAIVAPEATALPPGSINAGIFHHDDAQDGLGFNPEAQGAENHVIYHHVQDLLYKQGVQDMQSVKIVLPVEGVVMTPAVVSLKVGQTKKVHVDVVPEGAVNRKVAYSTSDATKATVTADGVIKGIAVGTATITVTTNEGAKVDTTAVTVIAA